VLLIVEEFCNACAALLTQPGLSPELAYRIKKMKDGVAPIHDKMYLKTLKGEETLLKCIEKTRFVKQHLSDLDDVLYSLLTDLEMTCDDLITRTYEFRVKAG